MKSIKASIDLSQIIGEMKPMHGVVNGPYNDVFPFIDVTERYKEAGIPFVRLHDTVIPNPQEVDISVIFPDFDADPEDPASYHFAKTDLYLECIQRTGAEIRYRLGESISKHRVDGAEINYRLINEFDNPHYEPFHAPKDPEKWAKICVGIVKHYNQGWAEGYHFGIKYWEIWEEPDGKGFLWYGTDEEYYKLYECTARALKELDPTLLVGGFAMCDVKGGESFLRGFLEHTSKNNLPLDFFSYDQYTNEPEDYLELAKYTRNLLKEYGYESLPIKLCEWNNFGFDPNGTRLFFGSPELLTWKLDRQHGLMGAAFYAASMIKMHESELEDAAVYTFNTTTEFSVFNFYGLPFKAYYAFPAFNKVFEGEHQVLAEASDKCYCIASWNHQNGAIMLSNFDWGEESTEYAIQLKGLNENERCRMEMLILNKAKNLEKTSVISFAGELMYSFILEPNDVVVFTLTKE